MNDMAYHVDFGVGGIFPKKYFHELFASGYIIRAKEVHGSKYMSNITPPPPRARIEADVAVDHRPSSRTSQIGLTSSGFPLLGSRVGGSSCGVIVFHVPLSLS